MSWWKPRRVEDVILYPGSQEVEEYVYTPGLHGLELAKALKEGKILGMKCGDKIIVPPLTFCPDHVEGELVEITGKWRVTLYTVIYEDLEGNRLPEPEILALIRPDGATGGLIHRVKAEPDKIYPGMPVEPVFKPAEERTGSITDILYFTPKE
ncbi:MAG: Zn-ribbon domain-containing OB-fold protein [Desulfurococcales archaeon]|nr:Zn-ribbon domain-containing OB-fold protein [Desulfurococcales archaeon]